MKRNFVRGFAVVLAAVSMLVMPATAARADDNAGSVRKITVSGQGTVKVKPDVAYVTLGVQTDSKDAKEAQAQNTKLMNDVIEAVKALGIAEKDIQTSGYYMYPQYNYNNYDKDEGQRISGYTVTNSVTVTVRSIEKVGDVIDSSISAGANTTSSIAFNVSDPTPYYQKALAAAMDNAKIKGMAIAGSLGVTIDLPLEVIEQQSYYSPMLYGNMNSKQVNDAAGGTAIQSGEMEISATVQVVYGY